MSIRNIIIYSFEHCAAALHAADQNGVEIRLLSSRGAAAAMGSSVFYALVVRAQQTSNEKLFTAALDCGHDCGHALAAIRQGIKYIILSDQFPGRERIANIAEQYGVQIISSSIQKIYSLSAHSFIASCFWL